MKRNSLQQMLLVIFLCLRTGCAANNRQIDLEQLMIKNGIDNSDLVFHIKYIDADRGDFIFSLQVPGFPDPGLSSPRISDWYDSWSHQIHWRIQGHRGSIEMPEIFNCASYDGNTGLITAISSHEIVQIDPQTAHVKTLREVSSDLAVNLWNSLSQFSFDGSCGVARGTQEFKNDCIIVLNSTPLRPTEIWLGNNTVDEVVQGEDFVNVYCNNNEIWRIEANSIERFSVVDLDSADYRVGLAGDDLITYDFDSKLISVGDVSHVSRDVLVAQGSGESIIAVFSDPMDESEMTVAKISSKGGVEELGSLRLLDYGRFSRGVYMATVDGEVTLYGEDQQWTLSLW